MLITFSPCEGSRQRKSQSDVKDRAREFTVVDMSKFTLLLVIATFVLSSRGVRGEDRVEGTRPGDERTIAGMKLCWCPAGRFTMGSPRNEPERRPDESQVEVTISRGFWTGKFEVTQGAWKRIVGKLPGEFTAELPEGDDYPVGNVNFAEAETCLLYTSDAADEL